jgi:hypothetical protein
MKGFTRTILALLILTATMVTPAFAEEYYRIIGLTRVDQDLYQALNGHFVETQYCYQYVYGAEATLKWLGQGMYGNELIWQDNMTCQVKALWAKWPPHMKPR